MTRLNMIHPSHLTQRHLVAEYKEITQFLWCVKARADKGRDLSDMPQSYTLNKGHCLFFYDKGKYIHDRFVDLYDEMIKRGIKSDPEKFEERRQRILDTYPEKWYNEYTPVDQDYQLVINRIGTRILQKPHLYEDKDLFFDHISEYNAVFKFDNEMEVYNAKKTNKS
jgi:deoxyribonuclease (pyrimidine dimer)